MECENEGTQIRTRPRERGASVQCQAQAGPGTIQDIHSAYTSHMSLKLKVKLEFLSFGKNENVRKIFVSTEAMCTILSQKKSRF